MYRQRKPNEPYDLFQEETHDLRPNLTYSVPPLMRGRTEIKKNPGGG